MLSCGDNCAAESTSPVPWGCLCTEHPGQGVIKGPGVRLGCRLQCLFFYVDFARKARIYCFLSRRLNHFPPSYPFTPESLAEPHLWLGPGWGWGGLQGAEPWTLSDSPCQSVSPPPPDENIGPKATSPAGAPRHRLDFLPPSVGQWLLEKLSKLLPLTRVSGTLNTWRATAPCLPTTPHLSSQSPRAVWVLGGRPGSGCQPRTTHLPDPKHQPGAGRGSCQGTIREEKRHLIRRGLRASQGPPCVSAVWAVQPAVSDVRRATLARPQVHVRAAFLLCRGRTPVCPP